MPGTGVRDDGEVVDEIDMWLRSRLMPCVCAWMVAGDTRDMTNG